jgi:RNA-binding protein
MAKTYNTLYMDLRSALRKAGVEEAQLEARELIKGRVLENSLYTAREAAEELSRLTRSEVVQVIGSKFVLYRFQHNKEKRRIELVRDRKKTV